MKNIIMRQYKTFLKTAAVVMIVARFTESALADNNEWSLSTGITKNPTLALQSLSDSFFGSTTEISSISMLHSSSSTNSTKSSEEPSSNEEIRYNFTLPTLRINYSYKNDTSFFNQTLFFLEYSNIEFPNGISMFNERGQLTTLTLGGELEKELISFKNFYSSGIGVSSSFTNAKYRSKLLKVESNYNNISTFLYVNLNNLPVVKDANIITKLYNDKGLEVLLTRRF